MADWAKRHLPDSAASVAYASTADSEAFAARWAGRMRGLGDGAAWIWAAASEHFPDAEQVLDICHASEHLAAAASGLFGEGTAATAEWLDGWPGLLDHVEATALGGRTAAGQAALDEMIGYFAKHTARVGYFGRLRAGRSIGSGAIEGLAKRMGRRLKVSGRGWCIEHLDGMAALIATLRPSNGPPCGISRPLPDHQLRKPIPQMR